MMRAAYLACIALAWLLWQCEARAHDDHDWIRKGGFSDANGYPCCSKVDCKAVPASEVEEQPNGDFLYLPRAETIKRTDTRISPDHQYWRCFYFQNGVDVTRRKCFWRPARQS